MNEEIAAGLRNAIERGNSLEQAVQSFINAGYNAMEVREAASYLLTGASTITIENEINKKASPTQQNNQTNMPKTEDHPILTNKDLQTNNSPKLKSHGKGLIITFVIILILLLVALILSIWKKDVILEFMQGIFG